MPRGATGKLHRDRAESKVARHFVCFVEKSVVHHATQREYFVHTYLAGCSFQPFQCYCNTLLGVSCDMEGPHRRRHALKAMYHATCHLFTVQKLVCPPTPSSRACCFLSDPLEMATTVYPNLLAYWIARFPKPPTLRPNRNASSVFVVYRTAGADRGLVKLAPQHCADGTLRRPAGPGMCCEPHAQGCTWVLYHVLWGNARH